MSLAWSRRGALLSIVACALSACAGATKVGLRKPASQPEGTPSQGEASPEKASESNHLQDSDKARGFSGIYADGTTIRPRFKDGSGNDHNFKLGEISQAQFDTIQNDVEEFHWVEIPRDSLPVASIGPPALSQGSFLILSQPTGPISAQEQARPNHVHLALYQRLSTTLTDLLRSRLVCPSIDCCSKRSNSPRPNNRS